MFTVHRKDYILFVPLKKKAVKRFVIQKQLVRVVYVVYYSFAVGIVSNIFSLDMLGCILGFVVYYS